MTDDRMPLRELYRVKSDATLAAQSEFQNRYGQVMKEARLQGIRPMPIGRLLAYLGYEMGTPIIGRAEAVNVPAMRRLAEPRKRAAAPKPETGASQAAAEPAAAKPEEEMKDEAKPEGNPR